ncbi:MAG TPA: tyrosine--tRNA ligase, partial [bacterium]|nr:tyrosine--tRNA ligase [bacterium]
TSPYEYYQYWINIDDRDVKRFLNCYTYLAPEQITELCSGDVREAKKRLAFEATKILHGEDEANKAVSASKALFSGDAGTLEGIPEYKMERSKLNAGINVVDLFSESGLCASKSEARRLIQGGGAYVKDTKIDKFEHVVTDKDFDKGVLLLRAGKKKYIKIILDK